MLSPLVSVYPSLSHAARLTLDDHISCACNRAAHHSLSRALSSSHWLLLSTVGLDPLNFVVNLNSLRLIGFCLVM
ncbi:hypothetical protein QQF64_009351 [Cirrhinus molitorella]|uniref:Uncharacterized protein n=1 Tax=Cirrhinus molitorella TaxID=172907 RepID=A0ABR3M3Y6_9TELE